MFLRKIGLVDHRPLVHSFNIGVFSLTDLPLTINTLFSTIFHTNETEGQVPRPTFVGDAGTKGPVPRPILFGKVQVLVPLPIYFAGLHGFISYPRLG